MRLRDLGTAWLGLALCVSAVRARGVDDPVRIKAALISRCLQYVAWPEGAGTKELRLGLLGADAATSEAFAEMARNVAIGGRRVRVKTLPGLDAVRGVDAVYADASLAAQAPQLWKAIEKRKIFLVTDRFPDKKYVMLNLALDREQSRLTFEINRANAVIEGFGIKEELLLLGGSEIDVRALYRKMRDDLIGQEEDVRKQKLLLERLATQVDSMRRRMGEYTATMSGMEGAIRESGKRIAGQEAEQKRLADEIGGKTRELARQDIVLDSQQAEIEGQQAGIARMRGEMVTLSAELAAREGLVKEGQERIEQQQAALKRQGARLATQRSLIFFMAATTVLLLALGAAVFAAYRIKRAAASHLEESVRKRTEELETAFRKQRELEANLQQAEKLKSIGQLAGGIAHDFNNQLGGILGFADLLREKLADRPALRDYAETIITLVGRSKDLTSQLLAFARKGQYQSVAVDAHGLVHEVMAILDRTVGKNIAVRGALCPEPAWVVGDPSQLQNAFLNLAINARDAMPKGGEILFSSAIEEVPAPRDGSGAGGGRFVRIAVKDTGTGMDQETLKHIFEPFFTTKDPAAGRQGRTGTGMGLAAVLGTVQAHRGFIEVDSQPGQGSEFRLYLPWKPQETPRPAAGRDEKSGPAPAKAIRILMVDDEPVMRELSLSIFASMGHAATACEDGFKALALYEKEWRDIDLVILDMIMPGMTGKELFLKMKAINPDVVAILASGYSSDLDAQDMLANGVRGFVPKPYGKPELAAAINDLFSLAPA